MLYHLNSDLKKYTAFIFSCMSIVLSNYFVFFFFSPTEGWWQTYAYLLSKGKRLYIDVDLAFPPLFIYYNSFLLSINDSYLFNRLVGVGVVLVGYVFLFLLLRRFYGYYASLFAALVGVYFFMFSYLYIPNDYHAFVNLFTVVSLYFFAVGVQALRFGKILKAVIFVVFMSIAVVMVLLVKQNIGVFLIAGIFVSYVCFMVMDRNWFWSFLGGVFVLFVFLFLYFILYIFSMSLQDMYGLIFRNDSKGSYAVLLGRFFFDKINARYLVYAIIFTVGYRFIYAKHQEYIRSYLDKGHVYWLFSGLLVFLMFDKYQNAFDILLILMLSGLMVKIYRWVGYKEVDVLSVVFIFLVLANSMTAEITVTYMYMVIAYFAAALFSYYENRKLGKLYLGVSALLVLIFISLVYSKFVKPYEWWGYPKSGVLRARYVLPYKQLRGIYVNKSTYELFCTVKKEIDHSNGSVYLFPHIPYFYVLHELNPYTKNIVQWFDVITTKDMLSDISKIKAYPPDLVVLLTPPWSAYTVHAGMKQDYLYQLDLLRYLDQMERMGKYKLVQYQVYDDSIFGDGVGSGDLVKFNFNVVNPDVIGKTIDELYADGIIKDNFTIVECYSSSHKVNDIRDHKFKNGDVVIAELSYSQLNNLMQVFGSADVRHQNKNVLMIYKHI